MVPAPPNLTGAGAEKRPLQASYGDASTDKDKYRPDDWGLYVLRIPVGGNPARGGRRAVMIHDGRPIRSLAAV